MAFAEDMVKLLTLHCREATALLSAAQDGKLSRVDRWALRMHLLICAPCRRYRRQLHKLARLIDAAVKRLEADGRLPGVRLSDEARQRLRKVIESGSG
ncbi:MAG: zf-HC2 domain-containing protein [Planctomycetota bacterium]|jgi:predicted anti-sigma-YlaC factor YlaD